MVARTITAILGLASLSNGVRERRGRSASLVVSGHNVLNYKPEASEFMILFKPGTSDTIIKKMCNGDCCLEGHPSKGGVAFAKVTTVEKINAIVARGRNHVEILEVDERDYIIPEVETKELGSGPRMQAGVASWGLERAGVPSRAQKGKGVNIYVQDTGIRVSHTDFGGRAISALDMTSGSPKVCLGDPNCAGDRQGHGTHCAGTAAGSEFGVASEARVYAVKTLSDEGSGARSWQMSALDWIATNAKMPAVVSMSLGGSGKDPAYISAIDACVDASITVVVAAGNSNADACNFSPAFTPAAITVGATTSDDERATYSNYGTCNDLMAPGSAIVSASIKDDRGSVALSGTSMACPHVSGGAALLLEADPTLNSKQILEKLIENGRYNLVAGLKWGDPNVALWVGDDAAPISPPTPAPPPTDPPPQCPFFAKSKSPDEHGDCGCRDGLYCSLIPPNRDCPTSVGAGGWGGYYFKPTCTTCRCYHEWR